MAVSGRKGTKDLGSGSQDYFELYCDPCHEVEGTFSKPEGFCTTCNEYMCTSCLNAHSLFKKTRNHKVLRGDDMPGSKPPEPVAATLSFKPEEECTDVCEKHRGQIIRYFCKYHNCLGCMDCIAFEHNCGSNVVLIADISSEGATELDFHRFSEKLDQLGLKFTDSVEKAEDHIKDAETQFKKANDDASQFSEEIINKIRSLESELERCAREGKDKDCNKMQRLINQSNSMFHEIKQMATDFESLKKCSRRAQQFTYMKKMHVRLEELEQNATRMDEDNFISRYRFCPEKRIKDTITGAKRLGNLSWIKAYPKGQEVENWLYGPRQDGQEEDVGPLCTIVVRGVQKVGSQDVLEMYFESKRRSGGGEIQEIRPNENDEDVIYITYVEEEVAEAVANRSHIINGQELETWLYRP